MQEIYNDWGHGDVVLLVRRTRKWNSDWEGIQLIRTDETKLATRNVTVIGLQGGPKIVLYALT